MRNFALVLTMIFLIGCRDGGKTNGNFVSNSVEPDEIFEHTVIFPDTVYINELNDGEIVYKSPVDTITDIFSDPKQNRYVVFRTLSNNSYSFHKEFYVDSIKEYRIGAINNRSIPFYDLSFTQTGTYKISGLINDLVLIQPQTKNNLDQTKVRLIEEDYPISFNVVVIDSIK